MAPVPRRLSETWIGRRPARSRLRANSTLTGMAHVSELCDGFVQDIDKLFKVGQEVQARVINVDKENGKLSLGLKPSYFELGDEGDEDDDQNMLDADGQDSDDDLDQALLAARGDAMSSGDDGPGDSGDDESNDESDEVDLDLLLVS